MIFLVLFLCAALGVVLYLWSEAVRVATARGQRCERLAEDNAAIRQQIGALSEQLQQQTQCTPGAPAPYTRRRIAVNAGSRRKRRW